MRRRGLKEHHIIVFQSLDLEDVSDVDPGREVEFLAVDSPDVRHFSSLESAVVQIGHLGRPGNQRNAGLTLSGT